MSGWIESADIMNIVVTIIAYFYYNRRETATKDYIVKSVTKRKYC